MQCEAVASTKAKRSQRYVERGTEAPTKQCAKRVRPIDMSILHAAVLGIVQGLTEFLPVSSSGHLIFFPSLFGWPDQGPAFDAVIHLGTLAAVLFAFWREALALVRAPFSRAAAQYERRLFYGLLLAVVPAGAVGFFFGGWIAAWSRTPWVVAVSMIGWGVVLGMADWRSRRVLARGDRLKEVTDVSRADLLAIGAAQAIALIPGTSRSGITITAGLLRGMSIPAAIRVSFLLSIPTIWLAGGASLVAAVRDGGVVAGVLPAFVVGTVSAAVSGFLAIRLLLHILPRYGTAPFVAYRIAVGVLILLFLR